MKPQAVSVRLLGPPIVERDGKEVTFDTRKAVALLALLAEEPLGLSRDALAAMLWPDSSEERARSSLRRTLSVTVAGLGEAVLASRALVALDREKTWCDSWELASVARTDGRDDLERAVSLWRGDFLSGFSIRNCPEFEAWQRDVAEHKRERYSATLGALVEALEAAGDLSAALDRATRWLALDPLNEAAHRAVMRVHALSGARAAALRQYRQCVRVLDEELGVPPLGETTALYEEIRAGGVRPARGGGNSSDGSAAALAPRSGSPLVGRDEALEELRAALPDMGGAVLAVHGASGCGKTRLVTAFADEQAAVGRTVLAARAYESERDLAYGVAAEVIEAALRERPEIADALPAATAGDVARLVPALARTLGLEERATLRNEADQLRLYHAVSDLLVAAGGAGAPVVVIDDAQWIDEASSRLVSFLLRRLDALAVIVVLAWQQEVGIGPLLRTAVEEAVSAGRGSAVSLGPLDLADLARWITAVGCDVGPEELRTRTGGLPLLVAGYLADPAAAGGGTTGAVPIGVRHFLDARLDRLPDATLQVLTAGAVLGGHFGADMARVTSGRKEGEVAEAIDDALSRGLLSEAPAGGGDVYAFPYEVLREVVLARCGPARRRLLHRRAAEALARRGGAPGTVADHLEQAGEGREAATWRWRAARRSVELYAHEEGLVHARSALELGHGAAEARAAVAESLIALGRYDEALAELEAAAALTEPTDPGLTAVEQRLAAVHDRLGEWEAAEAHLRAALVHAAGDSAARARVEADRALVAYRRGDPEAERLAEAAARVAEESGEGRALAQALDVSGILATERGVRARGEELLRRSATAAEEAGDLAGVVAARNNLSRALADDGRLEEALHVAEEALASGVRLGDVHRTAALHSNLADLLHEAGREDDAVSHLKEAAALFAAVQGSPLRPEIWTLVQW